MTNDNETVEQVCEVFYQYPRATVIYASGQVVLNNLVLADRVLEAHKREMAVKDKTIVDLNGCLIAEQELAVKRDAEIARLKRKLEKRDKAIRKLKKEIKDRNDWIGEALEMFAEDKKEIDELRQEIDEIISSCTKIIK